MCTVNRFDWNYNRLSTMNRNFLIGFAAGLLIFAGINVLTTHLSSDCGLPAVFGLDSCADDISRAGWPLQFYEEGGFAFRRNFNSFFFLINVEVGLLFSIGCGWIYLRSKKTLSK